MIAFDAVPELAQIATAIPTVAIGYLVFGIASFGASLVAAPVLAHVMPVATIVPMLALLDCPAAISNAIRTGRKISRPELLRLVPLMIIGSLAGAGLLLIMPPRPMMLALGLFVIAYVAHAVLGRPRSTMLAPGWVIPFGAIGGIASAMFGSGGFIYAIYLSRRLPDKDAIRSTQSVLIGLAAATRVVIYALAVVYSDRRLLVLALLLAPCMFFGTWAGHHITLRLTREQFLRIIYVVLTGSGLSLLSRALLQAG